MKKGLILSGVALTVVGAGWLLTSNNNVSDRTYESRSTQNNKKEYAMLDGRAQHREMLYKNSITGQVEPSDRLEALKAVKRAKLQKSLPLNFEERGPDNIGGRTRAITFDRSNSSIVYAGSVGGGLFKSTNAGDTWNRVQGWDEDAGHPSISSLEFTPNGTLYVATGGQYFEGTLSGGGSGIKEGPTGLWYSTDNGNSFSQLAGAPSDVTQLAVDPSQNDKVYISGTGGAFISENLSVSTISEISSSTGLDIKCSPDGQLVFAVTRTSSFKHYVSTDGGSSFSQLVTVGLVTGGDRQESAITDTKNNQGNYNIYVSSTNNSSLTGIYKSEDNGASFVNIGPGGSSTFTPFSNSLSGQGKYNQIISYVPGKPDECILGGIDQYHYGNEGWNKMSLWSLPPYAPLYIHADNHEMKFNANGDYYYGNDGGVGRSFGAPNAQGNFFFPSNKGYNVTQFYSIAHDKYGNVMAGAQDNGTLYNDPELLSSPLEFKEVMGGDGFDCEISHFDNEAMLATVYYSSISRSEDAGNNWQWMAPCGTATSTDQSCGPFHSVIRLFEDPNDLDSKDFIMYLPSENMSAGDTINYDSENYNASVPEASLTTYLTEDLYYTDELVSVGRDSIPLNFYALHPATADTIWMGQDSILYDIALDTAWLQDPVQTMLVSSDNSGIVFTRDAMRFGGLVNWITLASSGFSGTPLCFEFSWDGNNMYMGTSAGQVVRYSGLDSLYSEDDLSSITSTVIYNSGSRPVNGIAIDKSNSERIILALAGTGGNGVIELTNAESAVSTASSNQLSGIPTSTPCFDVIIDYLDPQKVVVGTDCGVWASADGGSTWNYSVAELGPIPVFAIRQQQRTWDEGARNPGTIYLGTHGRGVWMSGNSVDNSEIEHSTFGPDFKTNLSVYPNPLMESGKLNFELPTNSDVVIDIYTVGGKFAKTIRKSNLSAGDNNVELNVDDLQHGTYIITLTAGDVKDVTRFVKLK